MNAIGSLLGFGIVLGGLFFILGFSRLAWRFILGSIGVSRSNPGTRCYPAHFCRPTVN